jgi:hypothetical protein
MAKAKKKRPAGRKQTEIPGTEPPRIAEIDECAIELMELRDELKEMRAQETQLEERLGLLCGEHKVGETKDEPYTFVGDGNEPLECYREMAKRRMRVRKQKRSRAAAKSTGGGPGELATPEPGGEPGDDFGDEVVH